MSVLLVPAAAVSVLLVLLGGAVGASLRYLTDRYVRGRWGDGFPWGTLAVNVVGSGVLGALASAAALGRVPAALLPLAGTGFCGALTTFSAFAAETMQLAEHGRWRAAAANVAANVGVGFAACALGWAAVAFLG